MDDTFRPLFEQPPHLPASPPPNAAPKLSDGRDGEQPRPNPATEAGAVQQSATASTGATVVQAGNDVHWIAQQLRWLPQVMIEDKVERALVRFAPSARYDRALACITRHDLPLVVLSGPRSTGRRTAALNLLAGGPVSECLTDWGSVPRADLLPREPGGRYLLDLTDEPADVPEQFGRTLAGYGNELARQEARMVILVTDRLWRACRPHAQSITVDFDVPDPERVLAAHLSGSESHTNWLAANQQLRATVSDLLANAPMPGRAAELAAIILRQNVHEETASKAIRDEFHHWDGYLAEKLSEHASSKSGEDPPAKAAKVGAARSRALLISVAVLDGAPIEVVLDASEELLKRLRSAPEPSEILIGPELGDLIQDIDAERIGDTLTITRRYPGLDQAVLSRIWRERPRLRQPIRSWLEVITAERGAAANELARVADVLTSLATQLGSLEVLDILQTWVNGGARHRQVGITVLEQLSVSPEVGAVVRRRLYDWARGKADVQLLTGVAEVCAGMLGRQSPAAALSRLRLLLGHERQTVRNAAARALRALAAQDNVRPHVIAAVTDWFTRQDPAAGQLGWLALVDPGDDLSPVAVLGAVTADPELQATVRQAWSAMIADTETRASAIEVVRRWLACADRGTLGADFVIQLLGPTLKHGLPGDDFKAFITHGNGSPTHADLVMALVMNSFPDPTPSVGRRVEH
ncbi:hypothetical protein [Kribbella speibonae]|uniref:HEAT repeat domain-containing protein n=1 Tax=Kribbella speibonae TaxID=1572660 RepID=A0ABY2AB68_9ACTN|nr:hypothetical protein [Kribbella speibonae]TCC26895.1 hypothetical protein E0H58_02480 [Kribbella speibonae]